MKITIQQLREIRELLAVELTPTNVILIELIDIDLRRRSRSGRPKLDKELLERNAEAAMKYRKSQKMKAELKAHLERKKNERHDNEMHKAGLIPKRKKKRTKNIQRWRMVPKVKDDRLH